MDLSDYSHLWIVFALLSAFFHASRLAVTKRLSIGFTVQALTFYINIASLAVTFSLIIRYHDFPLENPEYLTSVLVGGVVSGVGGWSLNHAIKISEISLIGPLMTLTPGFVVLLEWLITGDLPGGYGLLGISLLMSGGYLLSMRDGDGFSSRPLQRMFRGPGGLYAMAAAASFAAATTLGRIGIQLSDPLSFAVMVGMVNPVVLFVMFSVQNHSFYRELITDNMRREIRPLLLLGLLFALMRIADQIALSLTLASYAMAVKRTAGVFSVVLGRVFFNEQHIPVKLIGSAIMLVGVFLLTVQ